MTDDDVHQNAMDDPLDGFLNDLRAAAAEVPAPVPAAPLLTLFREGAASVVAPAPRARRRRVVQVALAGAVAGLTFGGLGVAGALPKPVQRDVARVVNHIGLHLPDPEPPTTAPVTTTSVPRPPLPTNTTSTTVGDDQRHGDDHHSGGGDGVTTSTTTPDGIGSGHDGSGRDTSGHAPGRDDPGRIPSASDDVHQAAGSQRPAGSPQAGGSQQAGRRTDTSGGHPE